MFRKYATLLLVILLICSTLVMNVSAEKADTSPNVVEAETTDITDPRRKEGWIVVKGETAIKEWSDSSFILVAPKSTTYASGKKLIIDTYKKLTGVQKAGEKWVAMSIADFKDSDFTARKVMVLNQQGTYLRKGLAVYFVDGVGAYLTSETTTTKTVPKNQDGKKVTKSWSQVDANDFVYLDMS